MPNASGKPYDLEEPTLLFAKNVRLLMKHVPGSLSNFEDSKQLARSSGSVGANYNEANESLSKKDFRLRIKFCRKEAKESRYWLQLLDLTGQENLEVDRKVLIRESRELMNIFGAILRRSEESNA